MNIDDVDDAAALLLEVRSCRLGQEQGCFQITADQIIPSRFGDFTYWGREKARSVIHQRVQPSIMPDGFVDEIRQMSDVQQVSLNECHGVRTAIFKFCL